MVHPNRLKIGSIERALHSLQILTKKLRIWNFKKSGEPFKVRIAWILQAFLKRQSHKTATLSMSQSWLWCARHLGIGLNERKYSIESISRLIFSSRPNARPCSSYKKQHERVSLSLAMSGLKKWNFNFSSGDPKISKIQIDHVSDTFWLFAAHFQLNGLTHGLSQNYMFWANIWLVRTTNFH